MLRPDLVPLLLITPTTLLHIKRISSLVNTKMGDPSKVYRLVIETQTSSICYPQQDRKCLSAKGKCCIIVGKVTISLASYRLYIRDSMVY